MKNTGKNNGFTTPKNYFDGFADKIMGKIGQENSVIPKNDGFKLPEGYLENLNATVMHKVTADAPKVLKINPFKKYYYAAASIAAVVLLYFTIPFGSDNKLSFEDLANTDIENYLNETEISLSYYDLAEFLPIDEIEISDVVQNTISNDIVSDYLDNNNGLDVQELYFEDYE